MGVVVAWERRKLKEMQVKWWSSVGGCRLCARPGVVLLMVLEIDKKKKAMERSTVIEGEDRSIGGCGVAELRRLRGEGVLWAWRWSRPWRRMVGVYWMRRWRACGVVDGKEEGMLTAW